MTGFEVDPFPPDRGNDENDILFSLEKQSPIE